jgi:hypothetical protein
MIDENGREYKECDYCKTRMYRDEKPYNKLNAANWNLLKFCGPPHRRLSKSIFIKTKMEENAQKKLQRIEEKLGD